MMNQMGSDPFGRFRAALMGQPQSGGPRRPPQGNIRGAPGVMPGMTQLPLGGGGQQMQVMPWRGGAGNAPGQPPMPSSMYPPQMPPQMPPPMGRRNSPFPMGNWTPMGAPTPNWQTTPVQQQKPTYPQQQFPGISPFRQGQGIFF